LNTAAGVLASTGFQNPTGVPPFTGPQNLTGVPTSPASQIPFDSRGSSLAPSLLAATNVFSLGDLP
jgi:hypothetical protein